VKTYSLVHLSGTTLVREFLAVIRRERGITAEILACLAEFDERKLYRGEVKRCVDGSGGLLLARFGDPQSVDVLDSAIDLRGQVSSKQLMEVPLSDQQQPPDERGCVLRLLEALGCIGAEPDQREWALDHVGRA
jgi:hypothetical protein